MKEPEFRKGFNELIVAIMRFLGHDENLRIKQTWTRNMISNDVETAQIAKDSVGIIPMKIIWKNHPWVEDVEECKDLWNEEHKEIDPYADLNKGAQDKAKKLKAQKKETREES